MTTPRAWLTAAALVAGLSGCSPFPARRTDASPTATPGAQQLALQGQLSIKLLAFQGLEAKGMSMGFFFNGSPRSGDLDLMTPLGSQVARVHWTTSDTWLQTDKGERHFETLAELSAEVLGESLPLAALMNWVQGRPDPDLPAATQVTPTSFEQSSWHIDTAELGIGRVSAQRPASASLRGIQVRVRLDPP